MQNKKTKNNKVKVIITNPIRKGLRRGDICEISRGYANYLINNKQVVYYSPFMAEVYNKKKEIVNLHDQEFAKLNIHLNEVYLHFVRQSNKSFTLYGTITKEDVFIELINMLKKKNISINLIQLMEHLNINTFIMLPHIKTANMLYEVKLIGHLENTKLYLCVGTTEEQCQELENNHKKGDK